MNRTVVSVFPGQGSQELGMGRELFTRFDYHVRSAEQRLGYSLGDLCQYHGDRLSQTEFTQPAVYTVNILHYLNDLENGPPAADMFAGHSLGEYCALFAAGAFSFDTGLRIVHERGRLMAACPRGAMAAVQALTKHQVQQLINASNHSSLVISNINAPDQHVVSGLPEDIDAFEKTVEEGGGRYHRLSVSGAFHSHWMKEIAEQFREFLQAMPFYPLAVPVLCNVTGEYYPEDDREQLIELLVRQLFSPVEWQRCMETMATCSDIIFYEHGAKKILSKLAAQILDEKSLIFPESRAVELPALDARITTKH